jgi:hypothetical protein
MKTSKKSFLGIVLIALNFNILAQVGIGTSNPHASAALEIQSTSKGFLFPRMTEEARDAIYNPATGLTIYCTDCSTSGGGVLQVYNAINWEDLNDNDFVSASTGGMFTEKVGIGTTPIYALDVDAKDKGSSTHSARFTNSATDNNIYNMVRFTQGESGTAEGFLGTGGSNVLNVAFRNNFVVGTKSNSPLVLNTHDTERMRIDTIGRVGIGTTPLYALDVDVKDKGNTTYSARFTNSAIGDNISNIVLFTQGASGTAEGYLGTGGSGILNAAFRNNFVVGTKNNTPLVLNTNDTERMRIDTNGNVGIGTDDCDGYKLKVNGEFRTTNGTADNWTNTSDRRWKKDIKTLDNSLDKIATLRGVSYLWRVDDFPNKNFSDGTQLGVIAQEIETVFPELVHTDKKGYKSVQYSNIVAPLIEAIKTLKHQNEAQQDQITSLIERVKALEDK